VSGIRSIASRHVYRGFSSVRIDDLVGPTGEFTREIVEHPDAVAVVALDDQGRVALVRQYRHPLGTTLLELPAGTLDIAGETPLAAAHRELAEEVGLATDDLVPLGAIWNSAGWSDERTLLFLARRTRPTARPQGFLAEAEEAEMSIEWHALADLVDAALDGTLEDAKTVIGVLRARIVIDGDAGHADP
jgi:8-oxo-dGTP pyrophosphatase MutT (NUDIX family)